MSRLGNCKSLSRVAITLLSAGSTTKRSIDSIKVVFVLQPLKLNPSVTPSNTVITGEYK